MGQRVQIRIPPETTKQLILDGWNRLNNGVNKMVHSMPKRLKDVIELRGQMTAF